MSLLQLSSVNGGEGLSQTLELDVYNQPGPGPGEEVPGFLKLTEGGSLNLTCEVTDVDSRDPEPAVTLSWYLPNHFVERKRYCLDVFKKTLLQSPMFQVRAERVRRAVPAGDLPRDGGGHRGLRVLGPGRLRHRPPGQEDTQGKGRLHLRHLLSGAVL